MAPSNRGNLNRLDTPDDRRPILRTPAFDKALSRLGTQDRGRVVAQLEEFEKDWCEGRSIEDIRKQWDYKAPKVSKACKGLGLRQIRPTNTTRAWFAPDNESSHLLLLCNCSHLGDGYAYMIVGGVQSLVRTHLREVDHPFAVSFYPQL